MGVVSHYTRIRTTNSNTYTISDISTISNKIMKIKVRNNNIESALSILRRRSKETIFEYKEKQYFEKGSSKRHKAKQAAKTRERKRQRAQILKKGTKEI